MGYYTYFKCNNILTDKQNLDLETISTYDLESMTKGYENVKWYSHEENIKTLSLLHPDTLFEWEGEGEEGTDFWKLYVKNGKSCTIKGVVTFEPFSEGMLE